MKLLIFLAVSFLSVALFAQTPTPVASVVPAAPAATSGILEWVVSNWGTICTMLLTISEGLGFTKFGGVLNTIFSYLKSIGSSTP